MHGSLVDEVLALTTALTDSCVAEASAGQLGDLYVAVTRHLYRRMTEEGGGGEWRRVPWPGRTLLLSPPHAHPKVSQTLALVRAYIYVCPEPRLDGKWELRALQAKVVVVDGARPVGHDKRWGSALRLVSRAHV